MQDIPREQIIKRVQLLSEGLQEALFSDRMSDAILKNCALRDIAPKHAYFVGALARRVILGYLRPENFAFEIQKETGIDALTATQVAHDIDTEIFSAVRLELKKLYPPTIQTPTVQAPGFLKPETRTVKPEIQDSSSPFQEKPRYVVPIPERFKKPAPMPQPTEQGVAPAQAPKQETPPVLISAPMPAAEQKPAAPKVPQPPIPQAPQKPASPPMDPVVPLPTFIQSKFTNSTQPEIKNSGASTQDPSKDAALKSAFGKFTTPSTATGAAPEPASPYRETLEEPIKPGEQKPAAKVQGKVIDLSQF